MILKDNSFREVLATAISLSGIGRLKDIYSLPSGNAAIMIIYVRAAELNETGSQSVITGYYKCRDQITDMFREMYP